METKLSCPALKVANGSFFEEPFIAFLSGFDVSLAILEHAIKEPSEFMGAGVYCRGRSKTNLDASDECSDGGFALHGRSEQPGAEPRQREWHFFVVW
jgi:hypothetical protein